MVLASLKDDHGAGEGQTPGRNEALVGGFGDGRAVADVYDNVAVIDRSLALLGHEAVPRNDVRRRGPADVVKS